MAKILTVLSIILAGIIVASLHPRLSAASIACIILLMAGAVVLYHEMTALGDAKSRSQGKYAKPYSRGAAQTQINRYAASGSWSYPGVAYPGVERRGDSIDLCPSDSVEQIARQMISSSFRQAWQKYHAEHGDPHDLPGRIVQAQNLLLTAFRRD
jgi:hypothetical protein